MIGGGPSGLRGANAEYDDDDALKERAEKYLDYEK